MFGLLGIVELMVGLLVFCLLIIKLLKDIWFLLIGVVRFGVGWILICIVDVLDVLVSVIWFCNNFLVRLLVFIFEWYLKVLVDIFLLYVKEVLLFTIFLEIGVIWLIDLFLFEVVFLRSWKDCRLIVFDCIIWFLLMIFFWFFFSVLFLGSCWVVFFWLIFLVFVRLMYFDVCW